MARKRKAYLQDILESIERIENYTSGMDYESFSSDQKTVDASVNNLENIGEAAKNLEDEDDDFNWRDISDVRDVLVHQYFRADKEIIWDIIENELPQFKEKIKNEI
jgi:uncharacterized protein with HEPN domain